MAVAARIISHGIRWTRQKPGEATLGHRWAAMWRWEMREVFIRSLVSGAAWTVGAIAAGET
jgi:hypothetical protein